MSNEKEIVTSRFPDAYVRKYAALSMVIWCPLLDCRVSGFFHTEQEAWEDAVEWIKRKDGSMTFTINPPPKLCYGIVAKLYLDQFPSEDADFEVIQPKQIENNGHTKS